MMTIVERVLALTRAPALAGATTDALSRLAAATEELHAPAGERLFAVGDRPEALYVLLAGRARVDYRWGGFESGADCGPGELLGAFAVLGGGAHLATATIEEPAHLLRLPRSELEDILDEDGELARSLFRGLLRRLRAEQPAAQPRAAKRERGGSR